MAHSNRVKIRNSRGGKTRHQSAKAGKDARNKSNFDASQRMRELEIWMNKDKSAKEVVSVRKAKRHSRTQSAIIRRMGALERLQKAVKNPELSKDLVVKMNKEIHTLQNRI